MPLFPALTCNLSPAVQRYTALLLPGFICAGMVLSLFFSEAPLHFFGIFIPGFQIPGLSSFFYDYHVDNERDAHRDD